MDSIFNNPNFITGYRAFDVCRLKNQVTKIRSINNSNYDINNTNINNILFNQDYVNGKIIPYIFGNVNSFINFPDIIRFPKYTICLISKYNGTNKNKILNIVNPNNKISSFGHNNGMGGVIEYVNSTTSNSYNSKNNLNSDWVITCISYNSINENEKLGVAYIGNDNTNYNFYTYTDIPAIIGSLNINNSKNQGFNSDWALSHLFVWNNSLPNNVLRDIYSSMASYLKNPAEDDLMLFSNYYPRDLLSCVEDIVKPLPFTNTPLNVKTPWAIYYAGSYNSVSNVLPNLLGDKTKDIIDMVNIRSASDNNIKYIYGGINSYVKFPTNSINTNFTICSITRYNTNSNHNKILQSFDNSKQFYHGHYKNKIGVIEYNNFEFSKYVPTTSPMTSWVATCAKNSNSPNNVLINNNNYSLVIDPDYTNSQKIPDILTININKNSDVSQNSDWAMSYVIIWNSYLTDAEMNLVSNALDNYMKTGQLLLFQSSSSSSSSLLSSSTSSSLSSSTSASTSSLLGGINDFPGLYLTELQKKML
jgi:hypothetical protein